MNATDNTNTSATVCSDAELMKKIETLKKSSWMVPAVAVSGLIIIFAAVAICAIYAGGGPMFAALMVGSIAALLFLRWLRQIAKLKKTIGEAVALPLLREIFDVEEYNPNGSVTPDDIRCAALIEGWSIHEGSDYIKGSYKGLNFVYSDVKLQRAEDGEDEEGEYSAEFVTAFKGQWLICDFGRELAASVRLLERKGGSALAGSNDLTDSSIVTENAAFNEKFRILSSDGDAVFSLLTPQFMERLLSAGEKAKVPSFFCFADNKVHIALDSGRDSFEVGDIKLDNIDNVREKFRGELNDMIEIMDELLANDSLFRKLSAL